VRARQQIPALVSNKPANSKGCLLLHDETFAEPRCKFSFEPDSVDQVVSNWLAVPLHVVVVCVNHFVDQSFRRYGKVYIIHLYREQEKCSPACQNAAGHECQCSCMGRHHGAGNDGTWFEVSDTFATRWGKKELACRLLTAKSYTQTTSSDRPQARH
jgi:hypothetical protein